MYTGAMGVKQLILTLVTLVCLVGCRAPEGEERWPGSLDVRYETGDQLRRDEFRLTGGEPMADPEEFEIVKEITARKDQMFMVDPPQQVLDEAEMIFLRTGHLPELLAMYEEAAAQRNKPSPLDARIAWLYQRLGVDNLALEYARTAVQNSPEDPFAHFALAYVLGQQVERLADPYPEMIAHLATVLQLAPDFQVTGVVERNQLQAEYLRLRAEQPAANVQDETAKDTEP